MDIVAASTGGGNMKRWLTAELSAASIDEATDLDHKHKKMSDSAFSFPARWPILAVGGDHHYVTSVPTPAAAPAASAVGDIHLENFGTWRDREGRVVWGINDYDEAAEMPYLLDVIRLAASAVLAGEHAILSCSLPEICTSVLDGYARGIEAPEPFILDRKHMWLRTRFVVNESERAKFWQQGHHAARRGRRHEKERAATAGGMAKVVRQRATAEEATLSSGLLAAHGRYRQPGPAALGRLRRVARRPAIARRQGARGVRLGARERRNGKIATQRHCQRPLSLARSWYICRHAMC